MGDGKALQMGTSHELGQNFAKVFGTQFADEAGALQHPWQTSWGSSTRLLGALVMVHGDDHGLRLPPALAPIEVVVLVVRSDEQVAQVARDLADDLRRGGHRVHLDDRADIGFGRRSVGWELKGVPVRVEVGPRDLTEGSVTIVTRHTRTKARTALARVVDEVRAVLGQVAHDLLTESLALREARTADASSLEDAIEAASAGFARIAWGALGVEGETRLAAEGITVRCLQGFDGSLADDDDGADDSLMAIVGRAY